MTPPPEAAEQRIKHRSRTKVLKSVLIYSHRAKSRKGNRGKSVAKILISQPYVYGDENAKSEAFYALFLLSLAIAGLLFQGQDKSLGFRHGVFDVDIRLPILCDDGQYRAFEP